MMKLFVFSGAAIFSVFFGAAQPNAPWHITPDGGICRNQEGKSYQDHIEMAGKKTAVVLRYGVDNNGGFTLNKSMVWPMLRTIPNNTHASLQRRFNWNVLDAVTLNGHQLHHEQVQNITIKGILEVNSSFPFSRDESILLKRVYFPSTTAPALIESYTFTNTGAKPVVIEIPAIKSLIHTNPEKGVDGSYRIELQTDNPGSHTLQAGDSLLFNASVAAYKKDEPPTSFNFPKELKERRNLVTDWMENLVFESPDNVLNTMFAFSKIRACESIFETRGGPMHGPGGESYYAAIWANDQAEYINPYFPFTGYAYGNASALNAFEHFARFMNKEWKPIPSSIIAEGKSIWNGAGDRGDAAMIAYGAARYALAKGDLQEAKKLWPLIQWCLEYCRLKLNDDGVVASRTDELEGRFPAGDANLCTSSLYYDALISAGYLAQSLDEKKQVADNYLRQAVTLKSNIDRYFAHTVEGFDTYAYYKGNDILRAWICIPLTVGIDTRARGTIEALFSPRLWTENGLLTQAGSNTFWDRSTLYALRGVFMAGSTDKAMQFLKYYSGRRLLGDHVPYAIEAWPEGDQRHLSAESALYGRIVTEGIFGIRPTGFNSFIVSPRLYSQWNHMALKHIRAFNKDFDITVKREKEHHLLVTVSAQNKTILQKKIKEGKTLQVTL